MVDLAVKAEGDLQVDDQHTAEDVMICLGKALIRRLGDRSAWWRTWHSYVPMDEALALVAVDLGGRPYCVFNGEFVTLRALGNWDRSRFSSVRILARIWPDETSMRR